MIFAFILAVKIERGNGIIDSAEWNLYLKGVPLAKKIDCPKMPLLFPFDAEGWKKFIYFCGITGETGKDFLSQLLKDNVVVQALVTWANTSKPFVEELPKGFDQRFTPF